MNSNHSADDWEALGEMNPSHWEETADGDVWGGPAQADREPLTWRGLSPEEAWMWFEQLWRDVCMLRERYRLAVRSEWWSDERQVEVLAALAAWVQRYDSGEWDDPPGKLALLFDLERVATALREGLDPFAPERDLPAFQRYLGELGCVSPEADGRR